MALILPPMPRARFLHEVWPLESRTECSCSAAAMDAPLCPMLDIAEVGGPLPQAALTF